jgi:hypothetical protein
MEMKKKKEGNITWGKARNTDNRGTKKDRQRIG